MGGRHFPKIKKKLCLKYIPSHFRLCFFTIFRGGVTLYLYVKKVSYKMHFRPFSVISDHVFRCELNKGQLNNNVLNYLRVFCNGLIISTYCSCTKIVSLQYFCHHSLLPGCVKFETMRTMSAVLKDQTI